MSQAHTNPLPPQVQAASPGAGAPSIASAALFAGQRELLILHQGEQYRLRITRLEKLILTK